MTIVADPGLGKSAVLAELARESGCLIHFNVRSLGVNTAALFIQNICAQLIAEARLPYTAFPPGSTDNGAFLLKLMGEAARAVAPRPW